MNPFTRAILDQIRDRRPHALRDLETFVGHWDALDALVVRVYRAQTAAMADEAEYRKIRGWLARNYPRWQAALLPHWQRAHVAGEPAGEDPFMALLAATQAGEFVRNWTAMQRLPAAREALNQFLVDTLQELSE